MCRFAPIAPSSGYLTTLWRLAGGFSRLVLPSAQSNTRLPPRAVLLHQHPAPLQLSIHHLLSSPSETRTLSTWLLGRVAKAPRTDSHRSSRLSTCLSGRARVRISSTALCGNWSLFARGLESSAAWL